MSGRITTTGDPGTDHLAFFIIGHVINQTIGGCRYLAVLQLRLIQLNFRLGGGNRRFRGYLLGLTGGKLGNL
ncbi:MAG: hypothetical protein H6874_09545 [Hyphomicrobiaceae bacterium]|nr:hypothetical protein [Hyphomicrobiaceae bacterium]